MVGLFVISGEGNRYVPEIVSILMSPRLREVGDVTAGTRVAWMVGAAHGPLRPGRVQPGEDQEVCAASRLCA